MMSRRTGKENAESSKSQCNNSGVECFAIDHFTSRWIKILQTNVVA